MLKRDEISNPNSCLNHANEAEMVFVLLGRDSAAPDTIRFWANQRILMGKSHPDDLQIREAYACAEFMAWRYGKDFRAVIYPTNPLDLTTKDENSFVKSPCLSGPVTGCTSVDRRKVSPRNDLIDLVPYICLDCWRDGWRAEGTYNQPFAIRIYHLALKDTPSAA